ncbi:uncharacterized protein EDB91DRAFT_1010543, partial [Suillus paluster]|uniref:uncharacterized protein n=1 Tax=Suillus paluster TaxID=48578 RepID=UPI001B87D9CD
FPLQPAHALVNTAALFDEIAVQTLNNLVLPVRVRIDDRWTVFGPKDKHLFWVPPLYTFRWYPPRMRWVSPPNTQVDLSHMAHGLSWESCY